jgi:hypothetical protein
MTIELVEKLVDKLGLAVCLVLFGAFCLYIFGGAVVKRCLKYFETQETIQKDQLLVQTDTRDHLRDTKGKLEVVERKVDHIHEKVTLIHDRSVFHGGRQNGQGSDTQRRVVDHGQ